jgi:hypothetical protein
MHAALLPLPLGFKAVIRVEVDVHASHLILVRVLAKDPPESAHLPKDGCSVHSDPFEAIEAALKMPSEPKSSQIGDYSS